MNFREKTPIEIKLPQVLARRKISGIVVTFKRAGLLRDAVTSIFRSVVAADLLSSFEMLILAAEQDLESIDCLKSLHLPDFHLRVEITPRTFTPASGRNILLGLANSEWVCFLDDDIILPESYFTNFLSKIEHNDKAIILGGPNLNPPGSDKIPAIFGEYLANVFVTGPIAKRYGVSTSDRKGSQFNLMLCNLFIKSSFLTDNPFTRDLRTCEENELLEKMQEANGQWISSPDLFVWHHRRASIRAGIFQIYGYGVGRGQVLAKKFKPPHVVFVLPALICIFIFAITIFKPQMTLTVTSLVFGWCFVVWMGVALKIRHWSWIFLPMPMFIVGAYCCGICVGYLEVRMKALKGRFHHLQMKR